MSSEASDDGPWPALEALHQQQADALDSYREGFSRRRELLEWLLNYQHLTLGELRHQAYASLGGRRPIVGVALVGDRRERYLEDPSAVDDRQARTARHRVVSRHLRPACSRAYRRLRSRAVEYLDDAPPDAGDVTALRPGLDALRDRQRAALADLLDGFDALEAAETWVHDLDRAHRGFMADVDGGRQFDHEVLTGAERTALLEDAPRYAFAREQIAARYVLPACNRAVADLAESAGETGETDHETVHTPEPYE